MIFSSLSRPSDPDTRAAAPLTEGVDTQLPQSGMRTLQITLISPKRLDKRPYNLISPNEPDISSNHNPNDLVVLAILIGATFGLYNWHWSTGLLVV